MQYYNLIKFLLAAGLMSTNQVKAAYIPSSGAWSTLTPSGVAPSGATTDFTSSFAIAISPITTSISGVSSDAIANGTSTAVAGLGKRDVVSQIGDGQIQATTGTTADATHRATTTSSSSSTKATAAAKETADLVSQIGDGQVQATTATHKNTAAATEKTSTKSSSKTKAAEETVNLVSQIGDGQVQATKTSSTKAATAAAKETADLVSQIGDGQVQATTSHTQTKAAATKATTGLASQISDGQVQATSETTGSATSTLAAASQVSDGQIQNSATSTATSDSSSSDESQAFSLVACKSNDTLTMVLKDSILTDSHNRIGSIVSNHQFQFDAQPQAGALYAVGWSITDEGNLALGSSDVFYQCLSGTFYNLYDLNISGECTAVHLTAVELIQC